VVPDEGADTNRLGSGSSVHDNAAATARSAHPASHAGRALKMTPADTPAPGKPASVAVLLVNLGTPDAPTPAAVRRYLAEFLSDPRVVDRPRWLWLPILYGAILPLRPRRSARAYASIWTAEGSPLRVLSERLARKLDARARATFQGRAEVVLAMRYGEPSIAATIARLDARGVRKLIVLPLYPQYSATSTGSVIDAVGAALRRLRWPPELRMIGDYHDDAGYLDALVASVRRHRGANAAAPLLLSFHGIPQRYVQAGDPYAEQCAATTRALRARLGASAGDVICAFQSRVGREAWLQPYTDALLRELPARGVRELDVLCPGFAVDCLETLEEIAIRGRETFLAAGGRRLEYIAALNDGDEHVEALLALVRRHAGEWFDAPAQARA
jgi:ferrochelatase